MASEVKPGWQTSEFWVSVGHQVLALLALVGLIGKGDVIGLDDTWARAVAAIFVLICSGAAVIHYIGARTRLKEQAGATDNEPYQAGPPAGGAPAVVILLALALLPGLAGAAAPATAWRATVRVSLPAGSGTAAVLGSGTVIWTQPGRSLVLSCSHLWTHENEQRINPALERRPIWVEVVTAANRLQSYRARRTRIDLLRDLSLLEIDVGPLPHVCHVLPPGVPPGRRCLSCGFDGGKTKGSLEWATRLGEADGKQYTREVPRPGRSGGPLIDWQSGRLIGVVLAVEYEGDQRGPIASTGRGVYASHASVLAFLRPGRPAVPGAVETYGPAPALPAHPVGAAPGC